MSWVQVKSPNLNVPTSLGMCLKYVQDAFGSGWAGSYALQGWRDIVKKKHTNRNIPSGVYVPIWFEGYWNGVNYGHVAIYKDGVCWSSPYTNKRSHDRLGNIETAERVYGMKYIGWSEDIGGTTVIKKEDTMDANDVGDLFQIARGQNPTQKELKQWVGKPMKQLKDVLRAQQSWHDSIKNQQVGAAARKDKWQQQIYDLQARVKALGSRPTRAQLDAATAAVGKLSAQMKDAQAEATQARKDAAESRKNLEKIQQEAEQAEKEANNFLTALINAVRKMFGK